MRSTLWAIWLLVPDPFLSWGQSGETGKTSAWNVSATGHAERTAADYCVSVVLRIQADRDADLTFDWNHTFQHRHSAARIKLKWRIM